MALRVSRRSDPAAFRGRMLGREGGRSRSRRTPARCPSSASPPPKRSRLGLRTLSRPEPSPMIRTTVLPTGVLGRWCRHRHLQDLGVAWFRLAPTLTPRQRTHHPTLWVSDQPAATVSADRRGPRVPHRYSSWNLSLHLQLTRSRASAESAARSAPWQSCLRR